LKPYTKQDNSDNSSPSEEDDRNSPIGFMADEELAAEDPQILKYVKLEEKRRKYKDSLPKSTSSSLFSKRWGKEASENNDTIITHGDVASNKNTTQSIPKQKHSRLKLRRVPTWRLVLLNFLEINY
jgi:hypothetical protein